MTIANRDRVSGKRGRAEDAHDAHQPDPTGVRNGELQNPGQRNPDQPPQHIEAQVQLPRQDVNPLRPFQQAVELVDHSDAAPDECSQGRARHAQPRERSPAEDEAGIEHQVDDVRHPQQAHGDGCISRAAEDRVVQEQQQHRTTAAQADSGVPAAHRDDLRRGSHQSQQARSQQQARQSNRQRNNEPERNGLHRGNSRTLGIFFPDAARHHRGGRQTKPHAHGKHQAQHRLRESDGGHGIGSEASHPEHVHHGEQRLQHHLQHHGHGQQENGAVQASGGVILMRPANRLHQRSP